MPTALRESRLKNGTGLSMTRREEHLFGAARNKQFFLLALFEGKYEISAGSG
jgi:hypothetical protein